MLPLMLPILSALQENNLLLSIAVWFVPPSVHEDRRTLASYYPGLPSQRLVTTRIDVSGPCSMAIGSARET